MLENDVRHTERIFGISSVLNNIYNFTVLAIREMPADQTKSSIMHMFWS